RDGRHPGRGSRHLHRRRRQAGRQVHELRAGRHRQPVPQRLPREPEVRARHDAVLPVHRLPVRLLHGARQGHRATAAADAGDAAVLDVFPAARLRLEGPARRRRLGGQRDHRHAHRYRAVQARPDRDAGAADAYAVLAADRHDLHVPAVHDPAAVREPVEDGPAPAGGRVRSRRHALGRVLAGDGAAVQGRHHRGLDARVHPLRRRVRDARAARRTDHADDRPRHLGRELQQQRSAGGLRHRRGAGAADRRAAGAVQPLPDPSRGGRQMSKRAFFSTGFARNFGRTWLVLGFLFLYLPMVTLVVFSFNHSRLPSRWGGFSLEWYAKLADDSEIINGLWLSFKIALLSATGSVILGTMAAFSLVKYKRFFGRTFFSGMVSAPLVMPEVIQGLSLLLMLVAIQHAIGFPERGLVTIWLGHLMIGMSYATVVVKARLQTLNPQLEEAAMDLGARPWP